MTEAEFQNEPPVVNPVQIQLDGNQQNVLNELDQMIKTKEKMFNEQNPKESISIFETREQAAEKMLSKPAKIVPVCQNLQKFLFGTKSYVALGNRTVGMQLQGLLKDFSAKTGKSATQIMLNTPNYQRCHVQLLQNNLRSLPTRQDNDCSFYSQLSNLFEELYRQAGSQPLCVFANMKRCQMNSFQRIILPQRYKEIRF